MIHSVVRKYILARLVHLLKMSTTVVFWRQLVFAFKYFMCPWLIQIVLQGILYVRGDNKIFRFQGGKSESLFLQRKNPRRIAWTMLYRRMHKKGISEVCIPRIAAVTAAYSWTLFCGSRLLQKQASGHKS